MPQAVSRPSEIRARLRADVAAIALPRGRRVGTLGHEAAAAFLTRRLAELGLEPYGEHHALAYQEDGVRFANLVGVAPGGDRDAAPLLVGAHYDTVDGCPGADGNGAGVAIALEVARRLTSAPAQRDAVFALFDAREPPFFQTPSMGARAFYERQLRRPLHAALMLDRVGYAFEAPGIGDLLLVTGMESDPGLEGTIQGLPRVRGVRPLTLLNRYVGDLSDHLVFRRNRVPYLFLSCGPSRHHHRPTDAPDRLDFLKMAAVADLVEAMARDVATRQLAGPWEGYDTTRTDLTTMRATLGPLLRLLGAKLEGREDIDRVAEIVRRRLGL